MISRFPTKPVATVLAFGLGVAVLKDGQDGSLNHDYDGPVKIVEALASTVTSGPNQVVGSVYVEDTILGGEREAVRPAGQTIAVGVSVIGRFAPTDSSSDSVILPGQATRAR